MSYRKKEAKIRRSRQNRNSRYKNTQRKAISSNAMKWNVQKIDASLSSSRTNIIVIIILLVVPFHNWNEDGQSGTQNP